MSTTCPTCRAEVPSTRTTCPVCGTRTILLEPDLTRLPRPAGSGSGSGAASPGGRSDSSSGGRRPSGEDRFGAGTVLAGRYRIVSMLGRGGMGEVYRADDLKLGQPVALKFLPADVEHDARRLERFLDEVRIARQVAHPNVCRVYDVDETEGRHFLSMEYIDGEDLASLVRRIGRLSVDKGVDIARQLCAGLAAAHDRGVLHRDLKPANVMLDGRGKVKLTDFGLAEVDDGAGGAGELAGTPAYMAPEQFSGQPASVQTDLYALGLVLYEIFTGRRAFEADTVAELRRLHESSRPLPLSHALSGIDPAVERTIDRCLEKDPRSRPKSALSVSAALPGGDPLEAALAAGETPSPQMVAAAGSVGSLSAGAAAAGMGLVLAGLLGVVLLSGMASALSRVPFPFSPDVLSTKAREMMGRLGYPDLPADTASGFEWNSTYIEYVRRHDRSATRWKDLASGRVFADFWYRESPGTSCRRRKAGTA